MKAFIIFRDRVTYASRCAAALTEAGLDVVIADHGSTWPPALAWLAEAEADGVPVLRRGGGHPRGLWSYPPFNELRGADRYLVTDCDVVPSGDCPADWPEKLGELLDAHPRAVKAGLGLRTDDIPESYQRRDQVIAWESQFWQYPVADTPVPAYWAGIDTTLAVYRENAGFVLETMLNLRTAPPYLASHLAWHEDLDDPAEEIRYYYAHAEPGISHWTTRGHSNFGN